MISYGPQLPWADDRSIGDIHHRRSQVLDGKPGSEACYMVIGGRKRASAFAKIWIELPYPWIIDEMI